MVRYNNPCPNPGYRSGSLVDIPTAETGQPHPKTVEIQLYHPVFPRKHRFVPGSGAAEDKSWEKGEHLSPRAEGTPLRSVRRPA